MEGIPHDGHGAEGEAVETVINVMPSWQTISSKRSCEASGRNTGKGAGEAAICRIRVKHFVSLMLYATHPPKVRKTHFTTGGDTRKIFSCARRKTDCAPNAVE